MRETQAFCSASNSSCKRFTTFWRLELCQHLEFPLLNNTVSSWNAGRVAFLITSGVLEQGIKPGTFYNWDKTSETKKALPIFLPLLDVMEISHHQNRMLSGLNSNLNLIFYKFRVIAMQHFQLWCCHQNKWIL